MDISVNESSASVTLEFSSSRSDYAWTDEHSFELHYSDTENGTYVLWRSVSVLSALSQQNEAQTLAEGSRSETFYNVPRGKWYKGYGGRTHYPSEWAWSSAAYLRLGPPKPTGLISTARSIDGTSKTSNIAKMVLDWDDVAGPGVTYEVQQWDRVLGPVYTWKTLPFGDFTITFDGSSAVIGGLKFDKVYDHRVRAKRGELYSDWTDRFKTEVPIPFIGHQADHTVKYENVWVSAEPPPAADVAAITAAIGNAVDEWNEAVYYVVTPPPHVLFCTGDDCKTSSVDRNTDGRKITIYAGKVDCGVTVACVGPTYGSDYDHLINLAALNFVASDWVDENGHMKALQMRIEEPAFYGTTPYHWTNNPEEHRRRHNSGIGIWYYLPAMLMHEFGHAAGLHDLYNYDPSPNGKYSGHVMLAPEYKKFEFLWYKIFPYTSVPSKDVDYLLDVYRNHTTHQTSD